MRSIRLNSISFCVVLSLLALDLCGAGPPQHHGRPRKLRLFKFYGDGRSGKDLTFPAAYVELKYPVLRHPRKNTLPKPPPPHPHVHSSPPSYSTLELADEYHGSQSHHNDATEQGFSYTTSDRNGHEGEVPSSIVTYTKTTTIEKGPDGVRTTHEYEPPLYEASGGSSSPEITSGYPIYDNSLNEISSLPSSPSFSSGSLKSVTGNLYATLPVSAPLIENLGHLHEEAPVAQIAIQPDEKVIKNVQLGQYIWVRREEDTPNVRLTLDSVRRSSYYLDDVLQGRRIHIVSKERLCIQGTPFDGRPASGSECLLDEPQIQWDFVQINHGQYWIQLRNSNHCLTPGPSFTSPRFVLMQQCDLYEASQLWEIGSFGNTNNNNDKGWNN